MILIIEEPNKDPKEYIWSDETRDKFNISDTEVEKLLAGKVIWNGATAMTLEEETKE